VSFTVGSPIVAMDCNAVLFVLKSASHEEERARS
jgi:hypothetical protein